MTCLRFLPLLQLTAPIQADWIWCEPGLDLLHATVSSGIYIGVEIFYKNTFDKVTKLAETGH